MNRLNTIIDQQKFFLVGLFVVLVSFACTYDVPFFWDALSKSTRATWFYEHDFSQWVVPTEINSGHPPFWTLLLAFTWKVFGRDLLVTRILLLMLNIGVVYQLQTIINKYRSKTISWYWYLILFIEPTYLAQTTILNNDVLMLFLCLVSFNFIRKNRLLYSLAITGVLFCNLRGMLLISGFFLFDVASYYYQNRSFKKIYKLAYPYILPIVCFALFLNYQYGILGWIIKSPSSEGHRDLVGLKQFVINIASLIRAFADYGRFWFLIILFTCIGIVIKHKKEISKETKELMLFWSCLFITNVSVMLLSSNPIGHRYFMILYLVSLLVFVNLLFTIIPKVEVIYMAFFSSVVMLLTGHFWIYPKSISQAWDSSLAYLNYFEMKEKMKEYVIDHQIPLDSIGTKTRNVTSYYEYLREEEDMNYVGDAAVESYPYYVFSNIENETKDDEIFVLENEWILIQEYQKKGIFVRLYKSPKTE